MLTRLDTEAHQTRQDSINQRKEKSSSSDTILFLDCLLDEVGNSRLLQFIPLGNKTIRIRRIIKT